MNKETAQLMDEPNVRELHDTPTTADEASSPDLFTAVESSMILKKKKLWRLHRRFSTDVMKKINLKACQKHLNQVLDILTHPGPHDSSASLSFFIIHLENEFESWSCYVGYV